MKASKVAMTVSSLVIALIFGGGILLFMNLGSIAKNISEKVATDTLGVNVSIGRMDIDLKGLSVSVINTRVDNPEGYSGRKALTIEKIFLKANSFSETLLNFNDITVSGTEVNLEVTEKGTNLLAIKKNVDSKAAKGDKAAEQIKVIIENMRIDKMRVNPSVVLFEQQNLEPIVVPDIVLKGVGVKENGVLAREAIGQVWNKLSKAVNKSANNAGFYQGVSPDAIKDMGVGQVQQFKEQVKEDIDEFGKTINSLFRQ